MLIPWVSTVPAYEQEVLLYNTAVYIDHVHICRFFFQVSLVHDHCA